MPLSSFKAVYSTALPPPPGSILRLLYTNLETASDGKNFFDRYLPRSEYPKLCGSQLGLDEGVSVLDFEKLTNVGEADKRAG